ncbi:MAG: hypothetical protein COX44_02615 [Candidatus Portnoybacteria bacterium CG23_combo_of_CG06-09_8_20_14_all_37_13]|uniref:Type II toxin-antitoxin system mRNA interferase toxin, RelE/StbE family n=1 Tax=Candidatus Portnoybacteria bacterium CG23_combo_of_CG06-09_8_20_14_all_37_13 TaxID=1974819 RepID=A0A2G9YCK0_9BACT|nr:MAG: hypothetical protein COX44_02615 [Candidatus Portnoybacteria bacterium CG23_combo_of_CG06-09_8_20_14_all_37_13]
MRIIYSSKFSREYKKLPKKFKNIAEKQEQIFRKNPFDARLKTHKLHGKLKNFYSFSIGYKYRIIFEFNKKGNIYFHSVGVHTVYQ